MKEALNRKKHYLMHGGGEIFGKMVTNTKEAFKYWYAKGYENFEFDISRTDDSKYVTCHDFTKEAFLRLGIKDIPFKCTQEWFLHQELYTNENLSLHSFSLEEILNKVINNEIKILMIDPKDFTFDGTLHLLRFIYDFIFMKECSSLKDKLVIEMYNQDMLNATVDFQSLATYQYCVDDDIQQGNSYYLRTLPFDELISILQKYHIEAVSYPWKLAVENLQQYKKFVDCGFDIFSRTRNDIFSSLLIKSGVKFNIVDHIVTEEQRLLLEDYKKTYYKTHEDKILSIF